MEPAVKRCHNRSIKIVAKLVVRPAQEMEGPATDNDESAANDNDTPSDVLAGRPLRVCCYGSSSPRTPARYTDAAYSLGSYLARRGHTCVNGAGSSGCMAAMNAGASDAGGRIVGVIHEKFVVDGSDWLEGAHSVFGRGGSELLLATGNDLQERKRLLVKGADALIVLPGGPGTWDELWEMACAGHLGFHSMPIVCVNVDGYYDDFRSMLGRAARDGLLYSEPDAIVHFEDTPEEAVRWVEAQVGDGNTSGEGDGLERRRGPTKRRKRPAMERLGSSLSGPGDVWGRMTSFLGGYDGDDGRARADSEDSAAEGGSKRPSRADLGGGTVVRSLSLFAAGVAVGVAVALRGEQGSGSGRQIYTNGGVAAILVLGVASRCWS